jgi:hypothetical protein
VLPLLTTFDSIIEPLDISPLLLAVASSWACLHVWAGQLGVLATGVQMCVGRPPKHVPCSATGQNNPAFLWVHPSPQVSVVLGAMAGAWLVNELWQEVAAILWPYQ